MQVFFIWHEVAKNGIEPDSNRMASPLFSLEGLYKLQSCQGAFYDNQVGLYITPAKNPPVKKRL